MHRLVGQAFVAATGVLLLLSIHLGRQARLRKTGILSFSPFLYVLGSSCAVFAVFPVVMTLFVHDQGQYIAKGILAVGFGIAAAFCFASALCTSGKFDDRSIELKTMFAPWRKRRWRDLQMIKFNSIGGWHVFIFRDGSKIRISNWLGGCVAALDVARNSYDLLLRQTAVSSDKALEVPYGGKPWVGMLCFIFFGSVMGMLVFGATQNSTSIPATRIVLWFLVVLVAFPTYVFGASLIVMLIVKHTLTLTTTEISAPRRMYSLHSTHVPISVVTNVSLRVLPSGHRYLDIYYKGGRLGIAEAFLPNSAMFNRILIAFGDMPGANDSFKTRTLRNAT